MKTTVHPVNRLRNAASYKQLFLYILFCIPGFVKSQCIATSAQNGSQAVNDNSIGTIAFVNPGNALASNNSRAVATAPVALFTGSSNYLKITGFGFTIPSYAGICGVEVQIEKMAGGLAIGAWIRDNEVKLVKGNAVSGSNRGFTAANWGSSDAYYTHGDANDLWGLTLGPDDVNSVDFGVAISTRFNGLLGVFPSSQIDNIRVIIHYNPVLPTHITRFHATCPGSFVWLKWTTAHEEPGEVITLQRKKNGEQQWTNLDSFLVQQTGGGRNYHHKDVPSSTGLYNYRLRITSNSGGYVYSTERMLQYKEEPLITMYPNPASGFVLLRHVPDPAKVVVSNLALQPLRVPVAVLGGGNVRLDVSHLHPGIYVIRSGDQQLKLLRQ